MQRCLYALLAAFLVLTGFAVAHTGVIGFFQEATRSWAGVTILADLAIALSLVTVWLWRDAVSRGLSPVPYALLTLALGSAGPLLYLARKASASGCCGLPPAGA
jgi:hypothetical protein